MKLNDKDKFIGVAVLIIIIGIASSLYTINLPDKSNIPINQENPNIPNNQIKETISNSKVNLIGNVISYLNQNNEVNEVKDYCGDGFCDSNEDCFSCSSDCGECLKVNLCGNDACDLGECISCQSDCSLTECENGICEPIKGENCQNAPNDCRCKGDERCNSNSKICEKITCGNLICDNGETYLSCPNDCKETYKEVLVDPNKDYSIIFVHGHSPNEVEGYQPTALEEFQNKLVEEGYSDMGYILPSDYPPKSQKGIWSDKKVSVITTYYANKYDRFGGIVGPDDNQPIDVYSQRLADVVKVVKHNTGKNKVIIISHSMGGLVSRNYIKNYGGLDSVDKLIMVGTPNHGTYGFISFSCGNTLAQLSVGCIGGILKGGDTTFCEKPRNPTPECLDMDAGSNFIQNLNLGDETPGNIKYLTIIGSNTNQDACPYPKDWDNVVCTSSVYLDGAENYYYKNNGKEYGLTNSLHSAMVHPSKIPDVYKKIVDFIKS